MGKIYVLYLRNFITLIHWKNLGLYVSRPSAHALAPDLYLPTLALNLYLPALVPNLDSPALTKNNSLTGPDS